jgi:uncharacterized protein
MAIELDNSFTVPVPPKQAWGVLLDVQRIAPCMPGATVDEVNGDEVAGRVKVKVGPVSLTYKGTAKFTDRDDDSRTVSVEAAGKETRGAGTASAVIQAGLKPDDTGDQTLVTMHTTLNVTGRPAQFGRGVMAEISGKLVEQFATNLAQLLAQGGDTATGDGAGSATPATEAPATGAASAGTAAADGTSQADDGPVATAAPVAQGAPAQADSLNLIHLVSGPILKRVIPIAAITAAGALIYLRLRNIFRRRKA